MANWGKKVKERKEAKEKVTELFEKAKCAKTVAEANKVVRKVRNLAMRFRLRLPRELKRLFCKYCYAFFIPGKTVRIRTSRGKVVYACMACKKFARFPTSQKLGTRKIEKKPKSS